MKIYPLLLLLFLLFQLTAIAIVIPNEPAPMGISYYGINSDGATYSINTTAWLGVITIYNLSAKDSFLSQPYTVSFQLNTVLHYNWDGKTYALWIQNVAFYNTETHEVWFEDVIWNFSLPPAMLYVEGKGIVSYFSGQYYYSYSSPSEVNLTLPATIYLLINVSTQNQTVLHFYYNIDHGKWVNYDNVILEVRNVSNVYFLVNGSEYPPTGHYYATSLVIGGYAYSSIAYIKYANLTLQLFYWNGHNWQEGISAYNFDLVTGERVDNVTVKLTFIDNEPAAVITSGLGNAGWLWTEKNVSILTIYTNVKSGYVILFNSKGGYLNVSFINSLVNLTLEASNYTVLLYSSSELVGKATVNLAKQYVSITINKLTQSQTNTSITTSSNALTRSMQNTTVITQEHLKSSSAIAKISSEQQVKLTLLVATIITLILVLLILLKRKRL